MATRKQLYTVHVAMTKDFTSLHDVERRWGNGLVLVPLQSGDPEWPGKNPPRNNWVFRTERDLSRVAVQTGRPRPVTIVVGFDSLENAKQWVRELALDLDYKIELYEGDTLDAEFIDRVPQRSYVIRKVGHKPEAFLAGVR